MKAHKSTFLVGLLAVAALAATGCVVKVTFDPRGSDVSLEGDWTVDGGTATVDSCAAAGIDTLHLVFFDGGTQYDFQEFDFPCANGHFDTRPNGALAHGKYTAQWVAEDSTGTVLGSGDQFTIDASALSTTHVVLPSVDFSSGSPPPAFDPRGTDVAIQGMWTINGMTPDTTLCGEAGIGTVALDFIDQGMAYEFPEFTFPCEQGSFTGSVATGSYTTQWIAYGTDGTTPVAMADQLPFDVSTVSSATLATPDFTATIAPSLAVTIGWSTDPTGNSTYGTCSDAAVTGLYYRLDDATSGSTVDEMGSSTPIGCTESLTWPDSAAGRPSLPAGTYDLYIEGNDSTGAKHWTSMCNMNVVDTGATSVDCFADYM